MVVQRAKLLLLAAEGVPNSEIAERLGISRPTVIAWRKRYVREGLTGRLTDRPRAGRPQTLRRDRRTEILATTHHPHPPPEMNRPGFTGGLGLPLVLWSRRSGLFLPWWWVAGS